MPTGYDVHGQDCVVGYVSSGSGWTQDSLRALSPASRLTECTVRDRDRDREGRHNWLLDPCQPDLDVLYFDIEAQLQDFDIRVNLH